MKRAQPFRSAVLVARCLLLVFLLLLTACGGTAPASSPIDQPTATNVVETEGPTPANQTVVSGKITPLEQRTPQPLPPVPSAEQIQADLLGRQLGRWRFSSRDEFESFTIEHQQTFAGDSSGEMSKPPASTFEVRMVLRDLATGARYEAVAMILYALTYQGVWELSRIEEREPLRELAPAASPSTQPAAAQELAIVRPSGTVELVGGPQTIMITQLQRAFPGSSTLWACEMRWSPDGYRLALQDGVWTFVSSSSEASMMRSPVWA